MKEHVITTRNLRKTFTTKRGVHEAVKGVDLAVNAGEVFGFLGPNGAGKTTTLRMLTTLLPIDDGEASVAGFDVATQPDEVRRRIGYVSQKGGVDQAATGRENLILQGRLYGMSKEQVLSETKRLVDIFALGECIDRFPKTYSGGQLRRLDIALGMIHRPGILFLDEPTTGLDPQNRSNLWNQILALKELGVTIFLTSHYLDEVDFLSDRLAIMDGGKIVALDSPTALKQQISGEIVTIGLKPSFREQAIDAFKDLTFIREVVHHEDDIRVFVDHGATALPHILKVLDHGQMPLETIMVSSPSLNDVFLKTTGTSLRDGVES
ncbi:MAG: ATP-binding cassette domain-containing protein [Simkaniaceae bacterium]|nr:ATP-binding cassette domain-containing protein [Simkaniaceae bacterium]